MLNETIKAIERKVKQQRDILAHMQSEAKLMAELREAKNADEIQNAVEKTL